MTTGDEGATPPDAEHYLDLSGVQNEQTGPHFDIVLRGYDRRQVDDHVAGLRRMVAQLQAQLAVRQRRSGPGATAGTIPEARPPVELAPAQDARTAHTADTDGGHDPDTVGAFNDRLQGILQAAEQETQMVRSRAAESLLAEHAESRAALADLRAQRDAVFDDLVRLRGWLDELVATAGRPSSPPPALSAPASPARPGPWRPRGPAPGPSGGYAPQPQPQPQPHPQPRPRPRPSPPRVPGGADRDTAGGGAAEMADADAPTATTDVARAAAVSEAGPSSAVDADTAEAGVVSGDRSAG